MSSSLVFHRLAVLGAVLGIPTAPSASGDAPQLEITCGIVYSVGALPASGGWKNTIQRYTNDPSQKFIVYLFYSPFVKIHNPTNRRLVYGLDGNEAKISFFTPPIGLRFERLNRDPGFLTTTPADVNRLYVYHDSNNNYNKRYTFLLADKSDGYFNSQGLFFSLEPGETKVLAPDFPEDFTFVDDHFGDGRIFFDWRSDKTQSIHAAAEHGWRGPGFAYFIDWLLPRPIRNSSKNPVTGIVPARSTDTWSIEISPTGPLGDCRVFRMPENAGPDWAEAIPEDSRITEFPFRTKDEIRVFSTASVLMDLDTATRNRKVLPLFAVTLPASSVSMTPFRDQDQDGMDDAWELRHFGTTAALPNDDDDGDGRSNFSEFLTGNSPVDATDVFQTTLAPVMDPETWMKTGMGLKWHRLPQRIYEIQVSQDLENWTTRKTIRTRDHASSWWPEPVETPGSGLYYRIQASRDWP